MLDPDHLIALQLQEQFTHEAEVETGSNLVYKKKNNPNLNNSKSLVDPSWELIDPTPDIYTLFMVFNERYFWGKLVTVCVCWSKKMTTCAGTCSYQGRGGMCKITLSEPLLKLRPRKDLVETLLHEMIHAYLFVTNNNRDRDGHGPEFHKHMYRINAEAGTNITVYHDFHDEVRLYQQHWWRCNGICQNWKPYFGVVRRGVNRAPGPNDSWWSEHSKRCGGTFIKVKEPENFKTRKSQKENVKPVVNPKNDIRRYINTTQISKPGPTLGIQTGSNIVGFKDIQKKSVGTPVKNTNGTILITKTTNSNQTANNNKAVAIVKPFVGGGRSLINTTTSQQNRKDDYSVVRDHWLQRFQNQSVFKNGNIVNDNKKRSVSFNVPIEEKRQKIISPSVSSLDMPSTSRVNIEDFVNCPICGKNIENNKINEHLDSCLTENSENKKKETDLCVICNKTVPKEALNGHVNDCLDGVSVDGKIKCDLCSALIDKDKFSDHIKECLDEVFADDFKSDNDIIIDTKKTCNICGDDVPEINFDQHIERCLHEIYDASEPANDGNTSNNNNFDTKEDKDFKKSDKSENDNEEVSCLVCGKSVIRSDLGVHLDECMDNIFNKNDKSNAEEGECSNADEKVNCPFCLKCVLESEMIDHLNMCFAVS